MPEPVDATIGSNDPILEEWIMAETSLAVEHFGELRRAGKYGHRLTRDQYAIPNKMSSTRAPRWMFSDEQWAELGWMYEDDEHTRHTDEFCRLQREGALENFDLNMAFFAQISQESFEQALTALLARNEPLRPVTDLRALDGAEGVYVMVLDEYRQAYIGQTRDIRARIRQHWTGTKQFDRLLWGHKHMSVLSIDSFRALDTTRILAARTTRANSLEAKLVRNFPPDYLLNRIGGGDVDGLRSLFIEAEIKRRNLTVLEPAREI
jgi:hypothetical protein